MRDGSRLHIFANSFEMMLNSPSTNQTIAFSTRELDNRLARRHLELVLAGLRGEAAEWPALSRGDLWARAD
jgi:hypothetical protein